MHLIINHISIFTGIHIIKTSTYFSLLFKFTVLYILFFSSFAYSDVLGRLSASTNYLWRGVTQTDDNPAISAAVEYHAKQKSYLGVWSSNTEYGGRKSLEANFYLGHSFELEQAIIDVRLLHYYFPSGGKYNYDFRPEKWDKKESSSFTELQTSITLSGWNIGFSYSNNYLDSGDFGHYIELNYTYEIMDKLSVKLHIGEQKSEAIDDTQNRVGDRSFTLKYDDFFLTSSYMTDNEDGRQSDRIRYVFGWSIELFY